MRAFVVTRRARCRLLPASAGAQTLSLTESQALARLSAESPRGQAARRRGRRAGGRARGRAVAESARHIQP